MLNKKDVKIETTKGTGPGGQNKNKVETAVRATHIPTGISVFIDERTQGLSKRIALQTLEQKIKDKIKEDRARTKKSHRDRKIKEKNTIRTYDYKKGVVKDHRSKKTASLKDILDKGKLWLLR